MNTLRTPSASSIGTTRRGIAVEGNGIETLRREECIRLLGDVPIGRVVFTEGALPAIRPVNFVLDHDNVVIRTGPGSKLAAAESGMVVAFQADEIDADHHTGWSVVVIGRAQRVTDPGERARLEQLPLRPWAKGVRDDIIRISIEVVSGRRLLDLPPGYPAPMARPVSEPRPAPAGGAP